MLGGTKAVVNSRFRESFRTALLSAEAAATVAGGPGGCQRDGVRIASRPESAEREQRALVLEQEALQVQPAAEPG
jgi:hypothetical protein